MAGKTIIDKHCLAESTFNLISMSGGKDSLAQCLYAVENGVQHERVFADTGHEHPQTMDYLDYLEQKLGPILRVKADFTRQIEGKRKFIAEKWPLSLVDECGMSHDEAAERIARALEILHPTGNPFLDLCMWKGRFPSTKARFCTFDLKHEPVRTQVVLPALDEYDEVISWQGVRAQESPARPACRCGKKMQTIRRACTSIARSSIGCMRMYSPLLNATALNLTHFTSRDAAALGACRAFWPQI